MHSSKIVISAKFQISITGSVPEGWLGVLLLLVTCVGRSGREAKPSRYLQPHAQSEVLRIRRACESWGKDVEI